MTTRGENTRGHGHGHAVQQATVDSFDGNTMVRQCSTDDEEEDPFRGQTMMYAPAIDSPRMLLNDDEDNEQGMQLAAADDEERRTR